MPDDLKTIFQRYLDEVWTGRNPDAMPGYYGPGFVDHVRLPGMLEGLDGVRARYDALIGAFPDVTLEVIQSVAEGEKLASYVHLEATNTGSFMGIPPTGKRVVIHSIDISRFSDGKIVEHWEQMDMLGMMQQLGLAPAPEPAQPAAQGGEIFSVGEDAGDLTG